MKKSIIVYSALFFISLPVLAQTGGNNVYEFLNLTHSGLITSLGGSNVSLPGSNINTIYYNPSLLNENMDRNIGVSYVRYLAGINYGMALYSKSFPTAGNFGAGITYLNYGSFTEADESGNITGRFSANEYAISLIYSRKIDSLITVGANLKPIISQLESYTSTGIALDLGINWNNESKLLSAGFVIKNIGYEITTYSGEARRKLPFEIQAGITKSLVHAPFSFSLTFRHLERYDLTHIYNTDSGSSSAGKDSFAENMLRHVIAGLIITPQKNFYFSAGYNYQRRRELQVESKTSTTGFSWGFGINTSKINIEFGRAMYHLAGASTGFSIILKPQLFTSGRN
jgi:hypothetical protein